MILPKEKPLLIVARSIFLVFMTIMLIDAFGSLYLAAFLWSQDKGRQLMVLMGTFGSILTVFIILHKFLYKLAEADPELVLWQDHLWVKGGQKIPYQHITNITKVSTKRGKDVDVEFYIHFKGGKLNYDNHQIETGYDEIKYVLKRQKAAQHIVFEEIDNTAGFW
jgi:hypothetical protein